MDANYQNDSVQPLSGIAASGIDFLIGRSAPGGNPFNGIIDEVRIYSEALTAGEIQKHYAEGLERYKDLVLKD